MREFVAEVKRLVATEGPLNATIVAILRKRVSEVLLGASEPPHNHCDDEDCGPRCPARLWDEAIVSAAGK